MLFFGNKKIKRAEKYFKIHFEEGKRTKEYSDAGKRHLALTTPAPFTPARQVTRV